jgi:hypothetical protein
MGAAFTLDLATCTADWLCPKAGRTAPLGNAEIADSTKRPSNASQRNRFVIRRLGFITLPPFAEIALSRFHTDQNQF